MRPIEGFPPRIKPLIVPAGATILREGEQGTTLFVVVDGIVDVLVGTAQVATIGPGGIVGEMAVVTGQPRSATVVARTRAWLAPIDERQFAHLLRHTPRFATQLLEQLSERLREADRVVATGQSRAALPGGA
jgi:CRP-like cAMP-binding protein